MHCPYFTVSKFGVFDSKVKFPKTIVTPERPVTEYELELYTADCPGSSWLNGTWYPLKHGTLICAKPGQTRKSRLHFKCHYIHLQTEDPSLQELLNAIPNHFMLWQMQELIQIFHEMFNIHSAELTEDRLLLESCVCRLIHLLSKYRSTDNNNNDMFFSHQKELLTVEQYIRENLSAELTLSELAKHCSLSAGYFHSLFSQFYHKTPAQYVLECRIAAAKAGLLEDECNLSELYKQCGFTSLSYFCSKFKQVVNMTPMQYRREMLSRLRV